MKRVGLWIAMLVALGGVLAVELTGVGLADAAPSETVAGVDDSGSDAVAPAAAAVVAPSVQAQAPCDYPEDCPPPAEVSCSYDVPLVFTELAPDQFVSAPAGIDLGSTCDPRLGGPTTLVAATLEIGGVSYGPFGSFTEAEVDGFVAAGATAVSTLVVESADGTLTATLTLSGPVVKG